MLLRRARVCQRQLGFLVITGLGSLIPTGDRMAVTLFCIDVSHLRYTY